MNNLQDEKVRNSTSNKRSTVGISWLKYLLIAVLGALLPIGIYWSQTPSQSVEQATQVMPSLETPPTDLATSQTTETSAANPVEEGSATSSTKATTATYKLDFTREDITVGNKIKISPDQVRGRYANIYERVVFDYTVTSVRQITIPEKNVAHTVFQACYFHEKEKTHPECQVFVINTNGVLFAIEYPTSGQSIAKAVDDDVLNIKHKHRQLSIRPEEYPYIYQLLECGHSYYEDINGIRGGCFLDSENIDTDDVTLLVDKGFNAYDINNIFDEPENYNFFASKRVDGQLIRVYLNVTDTDKQTEAKAVRVEVKKGDTEEKPEVLLETEILTSDEIELEYDYENRGDKVVLTIGTRRYIYDFSNQTFYDVFEKLQSTLQKVTPKFVIDTENALNTAPKTLPPDEHEVRTILSDLLYPPESTQDFILKGYGKRFVLHSGVLRKDGGGSDVVYDVQNKTARSFREERGNIREFFRTEKTIAYASTKNICTYTLDTANCVDLPGAKLANNEIYGYEEMGDTIWGLTAVKSGNTFTIDVFDNTVGERGQLTKVRDITFTLP